MTIPSFSAETLQEGVYYFANIDEIEVHHDASVDPHDEDNDTSVIQEASELVPVQDFSASNSGTNTMIFCQRKLINIE